MTDKIARIDDNLLNELREIWKQKKENGNFGVFDVIKRIRKEFNIKQRIMWETLLLYGRFNDNEMYEHLVGKLIAIIPGVVVLDTDCKDASTLPSGLLERSAPHHTQLFCYRSFMPSNYLASLYIYPSTFPKRRRRQFKICPVHIDWDVGAGHGESYMRLGIDPSRWCDVMSPWLDKWLPKP